MVLIAFAFISVALLSVTLPSRSHGHHHHHHAWEFTQEERRFALQHDLKAEEVLPVTPAPVKQEAPVSAFGDPVREQKARDTLANLKNGTDFFVDYNALAVEEPEVIDSSKHYYFHYPSPKTTKYPYKMLSKWPRVYMFPEFITDAEADAMIKKANATMARSRVDQKENGGVSDIRTSSQTWLDTHTAPVAPIAARLRELTGIVEHELLQVLKYEVGQRYGAHALPL